MRFLSFLAIPAFAVLLLGAAVMSAGAATTVVYSSIPSPQPGNVPSLGNEAYSQDEIGDHIQFTASANPRTLATVDVLMSSWACESGHWYDATCVTTPGATFTHPLTLNLYAASAGPLPGALIATKTVTFTMPYRPSADPTCPDGKPWKDAGGNCFNGLAFTVTFDFTADNLALPSELIWGIAYNTSTAGNSPLGPQACGSNCPYDSLNVGLSPAATIGTDVDPDALYWDTSIASWYSDGGTAGVDIFRKDTGWTGYLPAARFNANELIGPPTSADQCKKGGWQTFNNPTFKNQGDCVSFIASKGKAKGNP